MAPTILMGTATAGAQAAQAERIPLQPESAGQILVAGLLGRGVSMLEEAIRWNVPFVLDKPPKPVAPELMPWFRHLHQDQMVDKAKAVLRKAYARANAEPMEDISLHFQAMRVVEHLKEQVHEGGLHLYSQKWLFDSTVPLDRRLGLLKSMRHEVFGTNSASVAVATGEMPPLPAYTLPELVRSLDASWRQITFSVPFDNLKSWIGAAKPYLIEFPAPNIEAGNSARTDHMSTSGKVERTELGLGFFLLSVAEDEIWSTVVTPMLFGSRPKDGSSSPSYSKNYQLKGFGANGASHRQLIDLVRRPGRNKLARLDVCMKCGTIYSSDRADLSHVGC